MPSRQQQEQLPCLLFLAEEQEEAIKRKYDVIEFKKELFNAAIAGLKQTLANAASMTLAS